MSAPESALLSLVHYGACAPPSDLPRLAAGDTYSWGEPTTVEQCQDALAACLARGWLRVVDDATLQQFQAGVHGEGLLGPVYGWPPVGGVDFTPAGVAMWQRLQSVFRPGGWRSPFAYIDVVHSRTLHTFPTSSAALAGLTDQCRNWDAAVVSGPSLIGPWRVCWWQRFAEGYQFEVEQRMRWEGCCGHGGSWSLPDSPRWRAEPQRWQDVLRCQGVGLGEWLALAEVGAWGARYPNHLPAGAARSAQQNLGLTVSEPECRAGLDACLAKGWLRRVDAHAYREIDAWLHQHPAQALLPGEVLGQGQIDFTPAGAELFRAISREFLGPDWDAALHVERELYREEHRYGETEEDIESALQDYAIRRQSVEVSRVVPIGPWCVYWWNRFPRGYRLELKIRNDGR
jgi:hypothetical protein